MLWKILKKYGIPPRTIMVIKKMYTNIKIKLGIEKAEALFYSTSGVKQGDNLAPALFLFAIQATIETMHRKWSAMKLSEPKLIFFPDEAEGFLNKRSQKKGTPLDHKDTFYADDAAFIFLTKEDLIKGTTFVKETFAQFLPAQTPKWRKVMTLFPSQGSLKRLS